MFGDEARSTFEKSLYGRSRREEAQIYRDIALDQSLLTSAPTILKHALRFEF
jgi:hypothetical protein